MRSLLCTYIEMYRYIQNPTRNTCMYNQLPKGFQATIIANHRKRTFFIEANNQICKK